MEKLGALKPSFSETVEIKTVEYSSDDQESMTDKFKRKIKREVTWSWIAQILMWFIVLIVLFWLIYYSLKPAFVLQSDNNQVDTAKVLLAAVISALILIVVLIILKLLIDRM